MTFFENLLVLMLIAVILLQLARRLSLPYPALLAGAGVLVAFLPGSPAIPIEPETFLALFIAPVLVDAAFDFPLGATRRFLVPLIAFSVGAVIVTSAVVAWMAGALAAMPLAAGFALGAIIAPPDAAAATAVLRTISIPRNTYSLLQAESLFNDATALLIFSAGLELLASHHLSGRVALTLGVAAPGGVLFGIAWAYLAAYLTRFASGTLGGNVLQFILAYGVWILASHLKLSAVLATIAFAMTIASRIESNSFTTRMRVQSFAVWSAVVFALNVFAFMLMGMQAKMIVGRMDAGRLRHALLFVAATMGAIILVRLVIALGLNRAVAWWDRSHGRPERASLRQATFVGWCGMRGFVTMATALALPDSFPQRDLAVLTAFSVVLVTLVLQGATLTPLVRWLKLDTGQDRQRERTSAENALTQAAFDSLRNEHGLEADNLRFRLSLRSPDEATRQGATFERLCDLGLKAIRAKREQLDRLRAADQVSVELYLDLQEQMDWGELTMLEEDNRRIQEI